MVNAVIKENVTLSHWPQQAYLFELDEPMNRFDPETGIAEPFSFIVIVIQPGNSEAYVFPSTPEGGFVDHTMVPMRRRPTAAFPHSILSEMGYTVS